MLFGDHVAVSDELRREDIVVVGRFRIGVVREHYRLIATDVGQNGSLRWIGQVGGIGPPRFTGPSFSFVPCGFGDVG